MVTCTIGTTLLPTRQVQITLHNSSLKSSQSIIYTLTISTRIIFHIYTFTNVQHRSKLPRNINFTIMKVHGTIHTSRITFNTHSRILSHTYTNLRIFHISLKINRLLYLFIFVKTDLDT